VPAAVELDAGRFSLASHSAWRVKNDVIGDHLSETIDVMGIEGGGPSVKRFARGGRHE
jgi:hypothetical protein